MPTPVTFDTPELQSNEVFKGFDSTDALGKSYLDLHGKVSSGSIELLPEELRNDPAVKPFKNLSELTKSYVETKKMVGGFEKAPDTPEGYKLTPMQNLHKNVKPDMIAKHLLPVFHKAGIGNKAADTVSQGVLTVLSSLNAQQEQQRAEQLKTNETELRTAWGSEYDVKIDRISQAMLNAGGKEKMGDIETIKTTLKGNPVFANMMSRLVSSLSEDSINNLGEGGDKQITDSKGAIDEIVKMRDEITAGGREHPYWNEGHKDHKAFMEKWNNLHKVAYPG